MKRITLSMVILLLLYSTNSSACLNYYVIDSSGRQHLHQSNSPSGIYIYTKFIIKDLKEAASEIRSAPAKDKYRYISNYCATLIKLGRHKESIPILENLLTDNPDEYEINANLAVAYELNGEIDKALSRQKKAMFMSPESHNRSEWFHLQILEATKKSKDENLNEQDFRILTFQSDKKEDIARQISYQLEERVPLTKSTNNILSKVIEESGDFYSANISLEWAIELYAIAIGYSSDNSVKSRLREKINSSRQKLVNFSREGKKGSESKYLYTPGWLKQINRQINQWATYTPYYYSKEIMTSF